MSINQPLPKIEWIIPYYGRRFQLDKAIMSVRMKKWVGIIQEAANSGLTKSEFCAQRGINRRQFFDWQKRIRQYVLQNSPELGLPEPQHGQMQQIREVNSQVIASLPVFCELKPRDELPSVPVVQPAAPVVPAVAAFSSGVMVQFGQFQIYVNESASEKTLRLVFSVIQHA